MIALACLLSATALPLSCQADLKSDFVNPPLKFRSRPLWFWNNTAVTAAGVEAELQGNRDRSGYGGLAPLPFGAKFTPKYLSEEYFDLYGAAVKKARELGMFLTIYDEYGFPSGSGGANMGDGIPRFKNKYPDATLRRLDKHEETVTGPATYSKPLPAGTLMSLVAMNADTKERVDLTGKVTDGAISWNVPQGSWKIMTFVCVLDGDPNVDYLEPNQVAKYVSLVYQPYYDKFGKDFGATIGGAFYDEPTMYRGQGRLWTDRFNERFLATYGFSPTPYYPALWYDIGPETQAARNYLFGFRSELYASGYMKTVQDWCTAHGGIPLLGHQDQENIKDPVGVSGDLMKCYKYQDVPGVDKIGWDNDPEAYYKIISSVVYNWDKTQAMTETYGAMGNLSWDRLYTIVMEQYAKGINNFVQHGVWYNLSNITYLPELSYRNPRYADALPAYNAFIGRLNVLLQDTGRHVADIAVLYPISTLQAGYHFDGPLSPYSGGVNIPEADYIYLGELLATKVCRDFTFLHPEVLDERCLVKGDRIALNNKINHEEYKVLILPGHRTIRWSNLKKIKEFYDHGGKVIATGQLPSKSAEFGHDADVVAAIQAMFPGVHQQILATASTEWRESGAYEAAKAIDGAKETRWAPSDEQEKGWWLEVNFGTNQTFNSTRITEAFNRVTSYSVEAWNGSAWSTCISGTSLGTNKVDKFNPVTAARVRLSIGSVSSGRPSICEFEARLDDGPNLAHSDALIEQTGEKGAQAIYLNSPNESNMRQALDHALKVYDVEIESAQKVRYIHKVKDKTEVYFFANLADKETEASVRLRGKITPELWNPHTGEFSAAQYVHAVEDGQPVTRVKLNLGPVRSLFITGKTPETLAARWWSEAVESALTQAGTNRSELVQALAEAPAGQRDGLQFLLTNMPSRDLQTLSAGFLLENLALAYQARQEAPWAKSLPTELFLNDVLPYASVNEPRDNWRKRLYDISRPLVKDCQTSGAAGRALNQQLFKLLKVRYSRQRRAPDQGPFETMETGVATCTGLAILLVDACRAVGVPARVVGTPLWSNNSGNHTWVEIWDGDWHFTGAAEPDPNGFDRGWFAGNASQAVKDDPDHALYASSFKKTGLSFPLVWAPQVDDVSAVNVTDRYTAKAKPAQPAGTRLAVDVFNRPVGERVAAQVTVTDMTNPAVRFTGTSKNETADMNDHLSFQLPKQHTFVIEAEREGQKRRQYFTTTANPEDRLGVFLSGIPPVPAALSNRYTPPLVTQPLAASDEAKLKEALTAFFTAPPNQQATWEFDRSLETLLRDHEPAVRRAAWESFRTAPIHAALKQDFDAKQVRFDTHLSPYTVKTVGTRPANGWALFIAMHGGGGAPQELNDSQWRHMQIYYRDHPEVGGYIYVALRAPDNTWNGFYTGYIYPLIQNLLRQFVLFGDVDPNKQFIMGYSHGGYGAFAIGPKMPDYFAAIHASAAAPADGAGPITLRNTVFTCMVGVKDTMYGRYSRVQGFEKEIQNLRGDRTDIYPVTVQFIADHPHSGLPDRDKISEMYSAVRNPVPRELTWGLSDGVIHDFFWLHVPAPGPGKELDVTCRDNHLSAKATTNLTSASILLDSRLVDFKKPIVLELNGQTSEHQLRPSLRTLAETLQRRGDPELAFTAEIVLPLTTPKPSQ